LLVFGCTAQAADPTRPPQAWLNALQRGVQGEAVESVRLQSILLPKQGRPLAIIGGHTVRLGERYGDDTLMKFARLSVLLRGRGWCDAPVPDTSSE
jgi:MSHA biogenesis protein MshK